MTANIPNIHEPSHRDFIINKSYPRSMMFWLPLMKEIGFKKEAKNIKNQFQKYVKTKVKSVLSQYITKPELALLRKKLVYKSSL